MRISLSFLHAPPAAPRSVRGLLAACGLHLLTGCPLPCPAGTSAQGGEQCLPLAPAAAPAVSVAASPAISSPPAASALNAGPPASGAAASGGSGPPPEGTGTIRGRILQTRRRGGVGEIPDVELTVELTNAGHRACQVLSYRVEWGKGGQTSSMPILDSQSGFKQCRPSSLRVAAGSKVQDTCSVASHGPLDGTGGIDEKSRVVSIQAACEP